MGLVLRTPQRKTLHVRLCTLLSNRSLGPEGLKHPHRSPRCPIFGEIEQHKGDRSKLGNLRYGERNKTLSWWHGAASSGVIANPGHHHGGLKPKKENWHEAEQVHNTHILMRHWHCSIMVPHKRFIVHDVQGGEDYIKIITISMTCNVRYLIPTSRCLVRKRMKRAFETRPRRVFSRATALGRFSYRHDDASSITDKKKGTPVISWSPALGRPAGLKCHPVIRPWAPPLWNPGGVASSYPLFLTSRWVLKTAIASASRGTSQKMPGRKPLWNTETTCHNLAISILESSSYASVLRVLMSSWGLQFWRVFGFTRQSSWRDRLNSVLIIVIYLWLD